MKKQHDLIIYNYNNLSVNKNNQKINEKNLKTRNKSLIISKKYYHGNVIKNSINKINLFVENYKPNTETIHSIIKNKIDEKSILDNSSNEKEYIKSESISKFKSNYFHTKIIHSKGNHSADKNQNKEYLKYKDYDLNTTDINYFNFKDKFHYFHSNMIKNFQKEKNLFDFIATKHNIL